MEQITMSLSPHFWYGDNQLQKVKTLGRGSYGEVGLYKGGGIEVAIKSVAGNDIEIDLLNHYSDKLKDCGLVNAKFLGRVESGKIGFIAMEVMDGTLVKCLQEGLKIEETIKIVEEICEILTCLKELGLFYVDLKLDNIMYKDTGGMRKYYLVDIGSICKPPDIAIATYPTPECYPDCYKRMSRDEMKNKSTNEESGIRVHRVGGKIVSREPLCDEHLLKWGLIVLFITLATQNFEWEELFYYKNNNLDNIRNKISAMQEGDILKVFEIDELLLTYRKLSMEQVMKHLRTWLNIYQKPKFPFIIE
jgi:serine/threonine protein kinase